MILKILTGVKLFSLGTITSDIRENQVILFFWCKCSVYLCVKIYAYVKISGRFASYVLLKNVNKIFKKKTLYWLRLV